MDDPVESGNGAYNLAACMVSSSRIPEAKDWLVDARVELSRARMSQGNVWLMEAKIAQDRGRFDEASIYLRRAACSSVPCDEEECLCAPGDPCEQGCAAQIPCVGKHITEKAEERDCEDGYKAQVHLGRARWYAEQYDLANARCHFAQACELAEHVCDYALQAQLQNVAAMIQLACGKHLSAGWHLDMEAKNHRLALNYREIPGTLELAAAAYEQAGRLDLASDRLTRTARIYFGRGEVQRSWQYVKRAVPIAEASCSRSTQIRLALLAHELHQFVEESRDDDGDETDDESVLQTTDYEISIPPSFRTHRKVREATTMMIEQVGDRSDRSRTVRF